MGRNNKRALIYNQFPRRYHYADGVCNDHLSVIERMMQDLERIAAMGFNVVWINPVQLPGGSKDQGGTVVTNSLYAMADDEVLNPEFFPESATNEERENLLRQFTQKATQCGLTPIFDLVINHVANVSRAISNKTEANPGEKTFRMCGALRAYSGKFVDYIDWERIDSEERKNKNKENKWQDTFISYVCYHKTARSCTNSLISMGNVF